jgi:hypothetical protein
MKSKLIISSVFASILAMSALFAYSPDAQAQWRPHSYGYRGYGNWVAPAVVGGIIGYELARPRYYEQPVVVVQQPVYVQQPAQLPPVGYHYQQVLDQNCSCYKIALIPN